MVMVISFEPFLAPILQVKIPLLNAAIGGYTTVTRMLLESGANANGGLEVRDTLTEDSTVERKCPLAYGMSKENVTLCNLLIPYGATLDMPGIPDESLQEAKGDGLDSMLVLLRKFGIETQ
ncbi:uncharacterized protein CC84DRAFT_1217766 [Paraphaeosphaeria sporulosa]|uniref:Ankyrin n=1 Tax=Paraphaeosphaeria sporulosa TaxID=1460663 RepID=A0A177CAU3_9PLEO|nr:uncharacterized protein CC84DRAFT_1217766 [Paraphaeosphaeria sporulosa]OAG04291.1 hypothetical protein CC84DRAFT_1217766 [Paraphaeosphaeria sporulosa]